MLASKAGQLGKKAKEVAGADELKTRIRQLNRAERVARGSAVRPPRVEKVVKARNKVEHFGDANKIAAKSFTLLILNIGVNYSKNNNEEIAK